VAYKTSGSVHTEDHRAHIIWRIAVKHGQLLNEQPRLISTELPTRGRRPQALRKQHHVFSEHHANLSSQLAGVAVKTDVQKACRSVGVMAADAIKRQPSQLLEFPRQERRANGSAHKNWASRWAVETVWTGRLEEAVRGSAAWEIDWGAVYLAIVSG